jgi:hypothetical protein
MSLPRSRSHNGPTNPRNKSQTNPMRKHNSKSKGLRQSGNHQADCPQCPSGLSARRARIVCSVSADCPRGGHRVSAGRGGPSEISTRTSSSAPRKHTVCDGPTDRPPCHGPSSTLVQTVCKLHAPKTHRQNGLKERRSRTWTNTKNNRAVRHLVDGPW